NQHVPTEPTRSQDEKTVDTRSVAEIRRDAVQTWLRMRPKEAESNAEKQAATDNSQERRAERGSGPGRERESGMDQKSHSDRESDRDAAPASPPFLEDDASM